MLNAILMGLTLGLAAKYLIVGNYSSNFFSVIVGILGAAGAHAWAVNQGIYSIGEPAETTVPILGSMVLLGLYYVIEHRHEHHRKVPGSVRKH